MLLRMVHEAKRLVSILLAESRNGSPNTQTCAMALHTLTTVFKRVAVRSIDRLKFRGMGKSVSGFEGFTWWATDYPNTIPF